MPKNSTIVKQIFMDVRGSGFPYCRYLERDNGGKRTEGLGFLSSECFFGIEF